MDWTIVAMAILTIALVFGVYQTFKVHSAFEKRDRNLKNKETYLIDFQRRLEERFREVENVGSKNN